MIDCNTFHETKRERKYYEGKKQKALRVIDDFIYNMERAAAPNQETVVGGLKRVRRLVNDI